MSEANMPAWISDTIGTLMAWMKDNTVDLMVYDLNHGKPILRSKYRPSITADWMMKCHADIGEWMKEEGAEWINITQDGAEWR